MRKIEEGLTFDDVLLVPGYSAVLPKDVNLSTRLTRNIQLNIPLVSSAMDTVTEAKLAIAIAQEGGMGIIHKNMTIEQQAEEVRKVKKFESGIVNHPITVKPSTRIHELLALAEMYGISGVPVVEDSGQLVGIVTHRDWRFETDHNLPVAQIMTGKERLVTVLEGTSNEEVVDLFRKHRLEKILIVDNSFKLKGLCTVKDMQKAKDKPLACKESSGQLCVGAAIGTSADTEERVHALVEAGVNVLVVDTAHGHSEGVLQRIRWLKKRYPDLEVIGGKMHLWGQGQLQQAFEALKEKLHKAGIFDKARKKPIPTFPNHIGIISSATGDALQDILRILKERYPIVPITVYPTQVQGKQAAPSIVTALALANQHQKADVLILARGGGSLEDLWGFNEEKVAEALFKSQIPIITGIGHEMDFTIADFVADLRAPTPTAAAQACVPDQNELKALFAEKKRILIKTVCRTLDYQQFRLDQLQKQLVHPQNKLNQNLEKLGFLKEKLSRSILNYLFLHESKINHLQNVLMYHSGQAQIQQWQQLLQQLNERLKRAVLQQLRFYETQFKQQVEKLQTLSPLQTLSRGYAIVSNEQGHTLNDVRTLKIGQKVQTRLATGAFTSVIEALDEQNHKK